MRRVERPPRDNWEAKVEQAGLTYHHTFSEDGASRVYWDESAYYAFSLAEVLELERATNDLQGLCLAAAQHIIDKDRFAELAIPPAAVPAIKAAWEAEPPAIYGRFDLAYDGHLPPKLLEYNADTPTALLEASVVQWYWLHDLFAGNDQFNSIHEKLIAKWTDLKSYLTGPILHFAHVDNSDTEDLMTANYLRDTAEQAGLKTEILLVEQIGWNAERRSFVDLNEEAIRSIFKLYPWEWIVHEEFGQMVLETYAQMQWIEPIWKMMLSNKGLLPILWELNPNHPNLLPAYFDGPREMTSYVRKPLLSREGANISLVTPASHLETTGDYGEEGYVYQQLFDLPGFDGKYPVIGSWVIDQDAAGIGIRESDTAITSNLSRFVPHLID